MLQSQKTSNDQTRSAIVPDHLGVIWRCLKTQGCTESVIQQCLASDGTKDFVLPVIISVDLMQLAEMDSGVANLIVRRPLDGTMLFRKVVHQLLVTKGWLPDNTDSLSQLAVSLRFHAATLPDLRWASGQQTRYSGLVKLRGVVLGVTATVTYTRKFRCSVCGAGLKEVKSQRSLSDKLLAEVMVLHDVRERDLHTQTGHRQQTVAVVIRDDLCSVVEMGQEYDIIGTQRIKLEADTITKMFEVNNLLPVKEEFSSSFLAGSLPLNVKLLFFRWNSSPFILPNLMALKFADHVCPPNCFFKLKLLLLISLVLTSEVPTLHVVALCTESQLVERVMRYASRLAPRDVSYTGLDVPLGAKVTASPYPWASYFLHAGSLIQSSDGVCRLGDLRTLKKTDKLELQTALTEGKVQVSLETRYTGSLPRVLSLPLSCRVWGLLCNTTTNTSNNSTGTASFAYGATTTVTDVAPALLDAFSVVYPSDASLSSSADVTEDLVSHILASSLTCGEESLSSRTSTCNGAESLRPVSKESFDQLTSDDFKQYVQAARGQRSVMTVEAEWLLTSYLITVRHARAHTSLLSHGTAVPVTAWSALQALAHGVCRLSLRTAVLEADALMAVALYEESLAARHGISALNVFPEPHLPADSAEVYITTQLVPEMLKFHSRLLSFCANSGTGPVREE